jgi:hypothetical protein
LEKAGKFPQRSYANPKLARWWAPDIHAWIAERDAKAEG